ncbi:MAG TPA: hypothetical protein VF462_01300 [Micromonosporaceae bacterium]
MTSHDEPNEWGFAGQGTAPEPAHEAPEEREADAAEAIAVPGSDIPTELSEALAEITDEEEEPGPEAGRGR